MTNKILKEITKNLDDGIEFVVATIIKAERSTPAKVGAKMIVFRDGSIKGTIGGGGIEHLAIKDALKYLEKGESITKHYDLTPKTNKKNSKAIGMLCGGWVEVFFETHKPESNIIIFGGGHIALAISKFLNILDLNFSIIDDRKEFANKQRFPDAKNIYHENYNKIPLDEIVNKNSFIVIITHGHKNDLICLEKSIKSNAKYIGMIGSKTKVAVTFKKLNEKNIHPEKDTRVHSPIGLKIGGDSPEEIAISIIAEILTIKNR